MSRTITSPVKRFSGSVVLPDALTYPQLMAYMDAVDVSSTEKDNVRAKIAMLPGVIACVEKWSLDGVPSDPTAETFPSTPLKSSLAVVAWVQREINKLIFDGDSLPNA